ncbi:MAG: hypothetical protein LKI34_02780 [Bifidobacterium tibiigranuli]|jgi:poly-gamma-glutamate capsule biosynthesis protein CapA/YwtB (metallophosphatase superfamily)|uniref:hypothetical protein n=1 Tax=Bifidobacterium tibiigranuli TaxID=2172043 RepID=UPI0026EFCF70|nr:hypothetical protein [Bifidobacterium tibiigranuli]MCI1673131.1 hypothetical protein [Bifidobacterium tibiigranuli]MCI1713624.1 hypothetical protein [Bifidobacterium tibiigranuli]
MIRNLFPNPLFNPHGNNPIVMGATYVMSGGNLTLTTTNPANITGVKFAVPIPAPGNYHVFATCFNWSNPTPSAAASPRAIMVHDPASGGGITTDAASASYQPLNGRAFNVTSNMPNVFVEFQGPAVAAGTVVFSNPLVVSDTDWQELQAKYGLSFFSGVTMPLLNPPS